MSEDKDTLYIKIDQNTVLKDAKVKLGDIAKMECTNNSILRQLKQKKIYSFPTNQEKTKGKKQVLVVSILKIIELIHEDYLNVTVVNLGEKDFVLEFEAGATPSKALQNLETIILCVLIFFGSAFTIMAFNNDVSVGDVFKKFYFEVMGVESSGVTEIEVFYSIGLAVGILVFFNHVGKKKITQDPTPIQVEMRKYEKDIDTTFIENAERDGKSLDVD